MADRETAHNCRHPTRVEFALSYYLSKLKFKKNTSISELFFFELKLVIVS